MKHNVLFLLVTCLVLLTAIGCGTDELVVGPAQTDATQEQPDGVLDGGLSADAEGSGDTENLDADDAEDVGSIGPLPDIFMPTVDGSSAVDVLGPSVDVAPVFDSAAPAADTSPEPVDDAVGQAEDATVAIDIAVGDATSSPADTVSTADVAVAVDVSAPVDGGGTTDTSSPADTTSSPADTTGGGQDAGGRRRWRWRHRLRRLM